MPKKSNRQITWIISLVALLAVMVVVRATLVDCYRIPSVSMSPALLPGDRILVNRLAYRLRIPDMPWPMLSWSTPAHGDIVVFTAPRLEKVCVKRVIGLPGDQIDIDGRSILVPQGQYFVTGDNRAQSIDSRCFGCVDETRIIGRATHVLASVDPTNHFLPRWSRFCQRLN